LLSPAAPSFGHFPLLPRQGRPTSSALHAARRRSRLPRLPNAQVGLAAGARASSVAESLLVSAQARRSPPLIPAHPRSRAARPARSTSVHSTRVQVGSKASVLPANLHLRELREPSLTSRRRSPRGRRRSACIAELTESACQPRNSTRLPPHEKACTVTPAKNAHPLNADVVSATTWPGRRPRAAPQPTTVGQPWPGSAFRQSRTRRR